jgi:hypothetical protein
MGSIHTRLRREIQKLQGFQWTLVDILLKTSLCGHYQESTSDLGDFPWKFSDYLHFS